jgi:hypothetical protein
MTKKVFDQVFLGRWGDSEKKKPPGWEAFERFRRRELLLVAIVTLGGATIFFVAAFAGVAVGSFFVDGDLCRSSFVTSGTIHFLAMGFVVKGDVTFFVLVGNSVGGIGHCKGEGDQHYGNNQFFHVFSPLGLVFCNK